MRDINSAIKRFIINWNKSVELRYDAAKIYAEACNTWNSSAKSAFKTLSAFAAWTPIQWTLLYFIGTVAIIKDGEGNEIEQGEIPPCYIGFARPSLPLTMHRYKVPYADMEDLFYNGAVIVDANGKERVIDIRHLQNKHIRQLYNTDGHKRTMLQQLKWLRDHQKVNFEVMENGTIHVRHRCYITPDVLAKLLRTKPYPLGATDLFKLAQQVKR